MEKKLISFVIPTHMPGYGGWGNGYVAVPKGHPAYEKDYSDDIFDGIEVHYGLTFADYANKNHPEGVQGMWVLGFDTLHVGDNMIKWPDEQSVMNEAENLLKQLEQLTPSGLAVDAEEKK